MRDILVFSATGLGQGAVFAALALGLLVTFKGTGVINFAAGAMGAWCAFVYGDLRTDGTLVLPIGRFDLGDPVGTVPAILIATVTGIILGLLVQVLVFKHLRTAPALAKVVASAGLMLAFQALIVLRFGSDPRIIAPILPSETVSIGGGTVPRDRLWLTAIVVLIAVVVAVWFRVSRGVASPFGPPPTTKDSCPSPATRPTSSPRRRGRSPPASSRSSPCSPRPSSASARSRSRSSSCPPSRACSSAGSARSASRSAPASSWARSTRTSPTGPPSRGGRTGRARACRRRSP